MKFPAFLAASLLVLSIAHSAEPAFQTPIKAEQLDPAAFADWVEGAEKPIEGIKEGPRWGLWTQNSRAGWSGVDFGKTKTPGVRHLRIAWKDAVPTGSVVVRAGGRLSVLRADAPYPGDLNNNAHWLAAERIKGDAVTRDEVGAEEYAVWVLPPGTTTRALRFTHTSQASDADYAGHLGAAYVVPQRIVNIAPQAVANARAHNDVAARLNDTSNNSTWITWDNGEKGAELLISPEHPEWVALVWPRAVPISGVAAIWAGFSAGDVQVYAGPAERHPREAREDDWKTVAASDKVQSLYPDALALNWFDFGGVQTTRAVRLRMTRVDPEQHDHLRGRAAGGKRVWLGEFMALQSLNDAEQKTALLPKVATEDHPPIAIRFKLPEPGVVTLVIEDGHDKRIRNLISETPFPAGDNVAWWDGTDDLGRDTDAARHGLYQIPQSFVAPGQYKVRGLWHKPVELHYEFSIYNAGHPAWETADKTGAWLTNHTPPSAACFVPGGKTAGGAPQVMLGSYVAEGGHGLAWVDLDGTKIGGQGWVGGNWTGAPFLACDLGASAVAGVRAYAGSAWKGELRLTALLPQGDKPVLKKQFEPEGTPFKNEQEERKRKADALVLAGLAVHDGVIACSLPKQHQFLFVSAQDGHTLGTFKVDDPRGIAFDKDGHLLALVGHELRRHTLHGLPGLVAPDEPQTLIKSGLDDPQHLALDAAGNLYISDQGASHQVKVFDPKGQQLGTIGVAGEPRAGLYDPNHMNHPAGLAIDERAQLWVTENDFQPKRVSVWSLDGKLLRAFYGPTEYGGGGTLDPRDKTKFYYRGMEFALDWEHGTDRLIAVLYRPKTNDLGSADESNTNGFPEQPIDVGGRRYYTNCFNANPTNGASVVTIWLEENHIARRVAVLGRANDWKLLRADEYKVCWPQGVDAKGDYWKNQATFAWSDVTDAGHPLPDQVKMTGAKPGGFVVQPDLSVAVSRIDGAAVRFPVARFTASGVPVYDLGAGEKLFDCAQGPTSSGGDQVLAGADGWAISTVAMQPFAAQSLGGAYKGEPRWQYPSLWPGLHASHESPVPDRTGEIIGTTRLLGHFIAPRGSEAGPLFGVNGNMGNMYLFTADGLFVSELFRDVRVGRSWSMPRAERGMNVTDLSLHDENFWPSITQTSDGKVYLIDGGRTSLVRVDGLETIRRIPASELKIGADDLQRASAWLVQREAASHANKGTETLRVRLAAAEPAVDGKLDEWSDAQWADIDKRGTRANFDSNSKPYDVTAAVAISGDRFFAAFRTGDKELLKNSGETPNAPFKTGGALDVMLDAGAGGTRLLITLVGGQPRALLYRTVVPGTREPVAFSSPWRTIKIDRVDDVSTELRFAADGAGNFEFSLPLTTLGLSAKPDKALRGDLGILRGNGFQTLQRVYWSNKATAIVSDVPSEAELTPALWGKWEFSAAK